jgi:hypothetical protein
MANSLEELFGKEWVDSVITSADSKHPLALWHKKNPDNPVVGYVSRLAEFILKGGMVKCDSTRLTSKLRADFAETLTEMDYSVFLGEQGFQVMMEPCWPKAGPDLVAAREDEYFVEIRNVGLGEARAAADAATIELFDRLGELGSRFAIIVSMTDEFGAYSPELKKAAKKVAQVLKELTEKHIKKASLYYYGPDDSTLIEGERAEPKFDLTDKGKLKAQLGSARENTESPIRCSVRGHRHRERSHGRRSTPARRGSQNPATRSHPSPVARDPTSEAGAAPKSVPGSYRA